MRAGGRGIWRRRRFTHLARAHEAHRGDSQQEGGEGAEGTLHIQHYASHSAQGFGCIYLRRLLHSRANSFRWVFSCAVAC
jgi:hypothetical protein